MPNFSFDPNRGIQDPLGGQDQLRMRNADLMTRMALENAARDERSRMAANQMSMFNMDRADRSAMFDRQLAANEAVTKAQQQMHKDTLEFNRGEGIANRAQLYNLESIRNDNALDLLREGNKFKVEENKRLRTEKLEDEDPITKARRKWYADREKGAASFGDDPERLEALGLDFEMNADQRKQLALNKLRTQRELEDTIAREQGLPTHADEVKRNQLATTRMRKVEDVKTGLREQIGDPELVALARSSPAMQSAEMDFKKAASADDPAQIQNAAANIKTQLMAQGIPRYAADKILSELAQKYRPSGWEKFKSFMAYPIGRTFGGGLSEGEHTLDSLIFENLKG